MYTIREFAKKRINSGVFARFVFFLSGITELMKKNDTEIRYSSKRFFAFFMQSAATKQFLLYEKKR